MVHKSDSEKPTVIFTLGIEFAVQNLLFR